MARITQLENEPKRNGNNKSANTQTTTQTKTVQQSTGRVNNTATMPKTTVQDRKTVAPKTETPTAKKTDTSKYVSNYGQYGSAKPTYETQKAPTPRTSFTTEEYMNVLEPDKKQYSQEAKDLTKQRNDERNQRVQANPDYELDFYQFEDGNGNVLSGREYKGQIDSINQRYNDLEMSVANLEAQYKKDGNYENYYKGINELSGMYDQLLADNEALKGYQANYNNTVLNEYESNQQRMQDLIRMTPDVKKEFGANGRDAINEEYNILKARNEELKPLVDDIKSLQDSDYYDYLLENGSEDEIYEHESYIASYDDSFWKDRARKFGSNLLTPIYAVESLKDVAHDLLGEVAGKAMESVAKSLNENGYIDDNSFNKISSVAKELEAFEYDNENNLSQQLREYRARIDREIQSGDRDNLEIIAGGVMDSAVENMARNLMLGKAGTFAMALTTFADNYYEDKQKGYSTGTSLLDSIGKGYITWWSENLTTERYFKTLGMTAGQGINNELFSILATRLMGAVPEEMLEEAVEYIGDYILDDMAYSQEEFLGNPNISNVEAPKFVPGDLLKSAFMAGASTLLSTTGGVVINATMSQNPIPVITNGKDYIQFSAELENIKSYIDAEADVDMKMSLMAWARKAEARLEEYEKRSATAGKVELEGDQPIIVDQKQAEQMYKQSLVPEAMSASNQQVKTDDELKMSSEYLKQISRSYIAQKGVIMNAKQYINLTNEKRTVVNNLSEKFNNIEGNNVRLMFDTNAPKGGSDFEKNGQYFIMVNPNSETLTEDIFKHEVLHYVANTDFWQEAEKLVNEKLSDSEKARRKSKLKNAGYGNNAIDEELIAYTLQDQYNTEEFLTELARKDRGAFHKLGSMVNELMRWLGNDTEEKKLARNIAKAYKSIMSSPQLSSATAYKDTVEMDNEYMEAVNSGDMEKAQQMVWEYAQKVAKERGQKVFEGYHGTNAVFNEFLEEKLGSKNFLAESAYMGYFMAGSKETAENYTGLNTGDMFKLNFSKEMEEERQKLVEKYDIDRLTEADNEAKNKFVNDAIDEVLNSDEYVYKNAISKIDELFPNWTQEQKNEFAEEVRGWARTDKMENGNSRITNLLEEYENTSEIHKQFQEANRKSLEEYEKIAMDYLGYTPNVKHLFAFMENPLVHDFKNEGRDVDFSVLMKEAKRNGNDGGVLENVQDGGDFDTIYFVFKPNQFKSADPVTYDDDGNIIPLSQRFNSNTNDLRYNKDIQFNEQLDRDYMDAVDSGDIETAQRLVDEQAKINGYDIKAYHGTDEKFTTFDSEKAGGKFNNYLRYGSGFYFAPTEEETKRYGKNTMSVFLSGKRLLDASKPVDNEKAYQYLVDNGYHPADARYAMNYGDRFVNALYETLLDKYSQGGANAIVQSLLREFGYDGVVDFYGANNDRGEVVVFDPSQIKSADPITYDDEGNVIPLSQRFNSESDDIRYNKDIDLKKKTNRYYATIAPYLDTQLSEENRQELINKAEKAYDGVAKEIAKSLGISPAPKTENIGGYLNNAGEEVRELSWTFDLGEIESTKAKLFTSLMGDLAFENQEAVICMRYLNEDEGIHDTGDKGEDGGTYGREYGFQFKDLKTVENSLEKAGITDYNIDRKSNYLIVQNFGFDPDFDKKLDILLEGNNYESAEQKQIYSYYLSREDRQGVYEAQLEAEDGLREGNESGLSGRQIEEANRRVSDVLKNGEESPFLRRGEFGDEQSDLAISDKDLKNYQTITPVTERKYSNNKNIDKETGVFKPEGIIELESTIGKTTHKEEIEDAEDYAGVFAQKLDDGVDPKKLIKKLKGNPLKNGLIRAYYVGQVLADRGMYEDMQEVAQWARDIDNLGGKLIESTKILYDLNNAFSRAVYLTKVQENVIDEYEAKFGKNKKADIENTINEIFQTSFDKIINSKTSREFRQAIGNLVREANKAMPKTIWDRIFQYRMWSMLSGTKTAVSNFVSNTAMVGLYRWNNLNQAILESALKNVEVKRVDETKTYKIEQENRNATLKKDSEASKRNKRYAKEIWKQLGEDVKSKYGEETDKIPEIIRKNLKIKNDTLESPLKKGINTFFEIMQRAQNVMLNDAPFAKIAFQQKFDDLAQVRGIDVRTIDKTSKQYQKLIDDAYDYAEEVVSHNATDISNTLANISKHSSTNVRVNDDSFLGGLDKEIKKIKEKANKGELGYKVLNSIMMKAEKLLVPFFKTNASLVQKAMQFSPIEWVQVANDYTKVKNGDMTLTDMISHMAKAITGTELWLIGAIFGHMGWLKWEKEDEDYSGRLSIKVPGTKFGYTVDFIDPISTTFAKGVVVANELAENGVSFKTLQNIAGDYEEIFLNDQLDMFSTMKDFFETVGKVTKGEDDYGEYTIEDGAYDTMFTIMNSYIPSIVRDVSRIIDPAKKIVYDTDAKKYFANRLINSTPFRTKLADKTDATGRSIDYTQPFTKNDMFNRIVTQMVSKGKLVDESGSTLTSKQDNGYTGENADSFTQMAQDFQFNDANGDGFSDTHWIRETVPAKIYPGGQTVEFDSREKDEYGKTWTQTWTAGANALMDNDVYKNLGYENQADVVYELQAFARECIEADYCKTNGIEMTEAQKTADAVRNFCTVDGKLDGKLLSLIALGTAKENKLASGGQRYVLAKQDKDGKTITNSRQLYMRQLYEDAGVYDRIVEAVNNNDDLDYQDFGLGKTVVEKYSEQTAEDKYQEIYGEVMSGKGKDSSSGEKPTSSSKKGSSKKVSGGSAGGITKAKGGGSLKKLNIAGNPIKNTKPSIDKFYSAYQGVFNRGSKNVSTGSSATTTCPNCGAKIPQGSSRCPVCGKAL